MKLFWRPFRPRLFIIGFSNYDSRVPKFLWDGFYLSLFLSSSSRPADTGEHISNLQCQSTLGDANLKSWIQLRYSYYVEARVLTDTITEIVMYRGLIRRIQDMTHIS